MASIDQIRASDGSGNASVATVQNTRSGGASTIIVDTVQGINTNFFATMGTPHTFTDPVTSETITVISEATAVDFVGHVDGSNLEIDAIAPGYVDNGSAVGDIIIIRPTTQWADEVADILGVSLNDDGTIKNDAISSQNMFTDPLDPILRDSETISNFVSSGGIWSQLSGLNGTMTAMTGYINGVRSTLSSVATRAFTASKDTYVDVLLSGSSFSLVYTEVTNGAASPALAANSMRIAKIVTSGVAITSVVQYGTDSLENWIYPPTALYKPSTWLTPTLLNGWVDYSSNYESTQYMKDNRGYVHIKGFMKNGTVAAGTPLFTLPVGFRPKGWNYYPVVLSTGACGSIEIRNDGQVSSVNMTATYTALHRISFKAEA